jgi:hypothetical protein
MDEHGLGRPKRRLLPESIMRSDEDFGDGRGFDPIDIGRNFSQRALVHDNEFRVGAATGDSKNALSRLPEASFGAEFGDFTGEFQSWDVLRESGRRGIVSGALKKVGAIESRGSDSHQHLIGGGPRSGNVAKLKNFGSAGGRDDDGFHCSWFRPITGTNGIRWRIAVC